MEELRKEHELILNTFESSFKRDVQHEIDWNERLLFIKGARGIGKTTLILQHIKDTFGYNTNALFVTMDSIYMANKRIIDIAKDHYTMGGTHLFIDEIHKYENWSQELKNIYDIYRKLKVVVSGSSILDLYKGNADLSRRGVTINIEGLSLREYINIETGLSLEGYTLDDILKNHINIAANILEAINPMVYFKPYLVHGYYPFYLEGVKFFHQKLNVAINQSAEMDIPRLFKLEMSNISKIRKLLYIIATSVPFQPNTTKLAQSLDLSRQTLNTYMRYLHEAKVLQLLWDGSRSYSLISKPEKIYLNNTNICHMFPQGVANLGNVRETFFMNQVSVKHSVNSAKQGDFLVDDKYIFEVGGENKNFKQIAGLKNSYLAIDNELLGTGNKIPLWLFGFLKNGI